MKWTIVKSAACLGAALILYYFKKRCGGPVCQCFSRLDDKLIVITGATSGIGLVVAQLLANRGATIIFTARNFDEGFIIENYLRAATKNPKIFCKYLDLNDFDSIRNFVLHLNEVCSTVDLLINNAGVFFHPPKETVDKFDVTFQTNYLGHFLLTELLLPKLTATSRIIFLSSAAHFLAKSLDVKTVSAFDQEAVGSSARFQSYANSKLCLLLYSRNLAQRCRERNINVYSVDPGSVETSIYRHFPFLQNPILKALQRPIRFIVVRTPFQGAQTVLHCALSSHVNKETGLYYADLISKTPSDLSQDAELSTLLYDHSRFWTGLA